MNYLINIISRIIRNIPNINQKKALFEKLKKGKIKSGFIMYCL